MALHAGLKANRFQVSPERRHRGQRELHPAVLAILAGFDPPAVLGPGALDMHALAGPVDVLTGERRRLTPAEAAPEADHEKRHPAWLERLAGVEQRPGLGQAEPLHVALPGPLGWLLADEELEVGRWGGPPVAIHVDLPLIEPGEGAPTMCRSSYRGSAGGGQAEKGRDLRSRGASQRG